MIYHHAKVVLNNVPLDEIKESLHKLVGRYKRCIHLNRDCIKQKLAFGTLIILYLEILLIY